MDHAEELLQELNGQLSTLIAERDSHIARTRAYWDNKPSTILNERLERIEIEKHYAKFTLVTADIRVRREQIIDALSQIEMAKPIVVTAKS